MALKDSWAVGHIGWNVSLRVTGFNGEVRSKRKAGGPQNGGTQMREGQRNGGWDAEKKGGGKPMVGMMRMKEG